MKGILATWDARELAALKETLGPKGAGAIKRSLSKAGSTALRDMRAEARQRIRARKVIKLKYIGPAFSLKRDAGNGEWTLQVSGEPVPLIAYPHRQTKKGVSVSVNRGKRTLLAHAFIARMRSGHEGIFWRRGKGRLPIMELLGSRPVDALLHPGEATGVAERGVQSFGDTFHRLLPEELAKVGK